MTPPLTRSAFALLLSASPGMVQETTSDVAFLDAADPVREIHVRIPREDLDAVEHVGTESGWEKVGSLGPIRATRDATVVAALMELRATAEDDDLILVAEAEHRSLTESTLAACVATARKDGAAMLATQVPGDVIFTAKAGKVTALPREGQTFLAAGLLVTRFDVLFDLCHWAAVVAEAAIDSPYRWSLRQLGATVLVSNDRAAIVPAAEIMSASA